jgi:hypothetical protein
MSAPTTQIYRSLIDQIRVGDRCVRFDITDEQAAQLIAGSEARAVEAADFALQQERNIHMTTIAERDQLRAELATERARLAFIINIFAYGSFYRAESRASIDSAMKEGAK